MRYERISDSSARASCFAKRRRTLFKMAYELNTLVGASVLVLVQHNSIKEFYCTEDMEEKLKQVEDRGRCAQVQVKTDTYTANPDDMAIAAQPSDRGRNSMLVLTFLLNWGLYQRMSFRCLFFRLAGAVGS